LKRRAFLSFLGLAPLAPTLAKALPDAQPLVHATEALPASDMAEVNVARYLALPYGLGYMIARDDLKKAAAIRDLEAQNIETFFDVDDYNEAW